jgi:hypothetical protein
METRHFNLLALAAVISLIAAGVVHSAYNSLDQEVVTGQKVFPALEGRSGNVHQVVLAQGDKTITLKKNDDGKSWGIVERGGYPVDAKKVREIVVKLSQAELIEPKTSDPKRYKQLELGDPKAKESESRLVRLADKAGKAIAEVVVGKQRYAAFGTGQSGTYLRKPDDAQTWLAKLDLKAPMDVSDWVDPVFFRIAKDDIKSIVVREGDTQVYKVVPDEAQKGKFKVVDIPAGRELQNGFRVDETVDGVRTLEMLDVRKPTEKDAKPDRVAVVTMADGTEYTIGMKRDGTDDRERWLAVAVKLPEDAKAAEAAKFIAEDTKGWVFRIAEWRARQTFKGLDDVYEAVKAEPETAKEGEAGAGGMSTKPSPDAAPK